MEPFDLLITKGLVLTMDPPGTVLLDSAVGVRGNQIEAVGPAAEIAPTGAKKILDAKGGIILPGLVNAHTHAAMTLFRGLADDLPLQEWLEKHILPAESRITRDMVFTGALLANAEMIASGTTCFCDMYPFEDAVIDAALASGMRAVPGEALYDFPSPNYGAIDKGYIFTEELLQTWEGHERIHPAICAHSAYLCAPEILKRAKELSDRYRAPFALHVSENQAEVDEIRNKYGATPVAHLANIGVLGPRVVADHCVVLTDGDVELLARHGVQVVTNPESNMKLASGLAPVDRLLAAGINVALGTDGCASNNNLDLFSEMDTGAKAHKVILGDPTAHNAETTLAMATVNGAKALGLDEITGSLTPGKRADIIVVDTRAPHLTPLYNPVSHLVYAARGSDVIHTVIEGRTVMKDRKILTLDLAAICKEARTMAKMLRG